MKKSALVTILLALITASTIATGQNKRGQAIKVSARSPSAVIVVNRDGKLDFVRDKNLLIESMQRAFEKVKERETVRDVVIRSFGKQNYLAIKIEDARKNPSTLFLELVPVSEGSAFHHNGPHVVTCINTTGCGNDCIVIPPYSPGNSMPSPACSCNKGNTTTHSCIFKINKSYLPDLLADFNHELIAVGFEATDGRPPTEASPRDTKMINPH